MLGCVGKMRAVVINVCPKPSCLIFLLLYVLNIAGSYIYCLDYSTGFCYTGYWFSMKQMFGSIHSQ